MERKLVIPVNESFTRSRDASLDPATFKHEEPSDDDTGKINISQVDHPLQVRSVSELGVPCACGRPLVGLDTEWIVDAKGYALFVRGVCLRHGRQDAIYLSAPQSSQQESQAERAERMKAEVTRLLQGIAELPSLEQPGVAEQKGEAA